MVSHYIITSSSYKLGTRIALHYEDEDIEVVKCDREKILQAGEDISFAMHSIIAEPGGWKKVVESDAFFDNIKVCKDVNEFIEIIMLDRQLEGVDIAYYILSKISCSHVKLEKLMYLSFLKYLNKSDDKKLFKDKIYAFDLGPVIETVYENFKEVPRHEEMAIKINPQAMASRIRFAEDGSIKLASVNEVLDIYSSYKENVLVELTHQKGGAWDRTDKTQMYAEIKFEDIVKYDKDLVK